jgi:hypothetical protein
MNAPKLPTALIRARRRPGIIVSLYLLRAGIGLALAWPLCELFARPSLAHPRADAVLFDPGGLYLVEAFRLAHGATVQALRGMSLGALAIFAFGLVPLGALMYALGREGAIRVSDLVAAAARVFGRFSALLAMAMLALAFVVLAALSLATAIREKVAPGLAEPAADLLVAAPWLLGAVLVAVIGVVHDLARAAVSQRDIGATDGVRLALRAASRRPTAALFGWAWRAALAVAIVALAAFASATVDVDHTRAIVAVAFVHQAAVLAIVGVRASWLACAIRLSERAAADSSSADQAPEELLVAPGRAIPTDVQSHDPAP